MTCSRGVSRVCLTSILSLRVPTACSSCCDIISCSLSSTSMMNIFYILLTLLLALLGHNIDHENTFQQFLLHASLTNHSPSMSYMSWAMEPDYDLWTMPDINKTHTFYMNSLPGSLQITSTDEFFYCYGPICSIKSFCTSFMAGFHPLSVVFASCQQHA